MESVDLSVFKKGQFFIYEYVGTYSVSIVTSVNIETNCIEAWSFFDDGVLSTEKNYYNYGPFYKHSFRYDNIKLLFNSELMQLLYDV